MNLAAYWEDERELREAFWHPQPDQVVFDIGCAEGSYTLPALEQGATVYAVDPRAECLDSLHRSTVGYSRLTVINRAFYNGGKYPEGLLKALQGEPNFAPGPDWRYSTLDIQARRYRLKRLDWVKVDVEGAEYGVLAGGLDTLKAFKPRLIVEDHTSVYPWVARTHSAERIGYMLDRLGYDWNLVPYVGPGSDRRYFVCS